MFALRLLHIVSGCRGPLLCKQRERLKLPIARTGRKVSRKWDTAVSWKNTTLYNLHPIYLQHQQQHHNTTTITTRSSAQSADRAGVDCRGHRQRKTDRHIIMMTFLVSFCHLFRNQTKWVGTSPCANCANLNTNKNAWWTRSRPTASTNYGAGRLIFLGPHTTITINIPLIA